MTTPKRELAGEITARIIAQLEQGVRPWRKPWNPEHCGGRIVLPLRGRSSARLYQRIWTGAGSPLQSCGFTK